MGNTVIPGPRRGPEKGAERAAALLDIVIVTAHLNADSLDTGGERRKEERKGVSVFLSRVPHPAPFQSPCVFARQANGEPVFPCELKVLKVPSRRIANCFVALSQGLTTARNWKYRGAAFSNRLPRSARPARQESGL